MGNPEHYKILEQEIKRRQNRFQLCYQYLYKFRYYALILLLFLSIFTAPVTTIATEKAEFVLQVGHTGPVNSVSFSPDGKQLASASFDKTVKI